MRTASSPSDTSFASSLVRPLAAGLALTSAGSLSAAIIYNGTPISGSQTFAIDPGDDFQLTVTPGSTSPGFGTPGDPGYKPPMPFPSSVSLSPLSGAQITAAAVTFGSTIDGSAAYTTGYSYVTGTQYFGFSLSGGTTLYGWLKATHVSGFGAGGTGSVDEWAYDDTGASIMAGQISEIPEPATTGVAAALLAGSAAVWMRRRQKIEAAQAA